jgi:hypothetical protein
MISIFIRIIKNFGLSKFNSIINHVKLIFDKKEYEPAQIFER